MSLSSLQAVIIGGATTIIDYNLTPNKVVVSNAEGKISTSSVSNVEVGYLAGTTDLIQTQLNSKANQSTTYNTTEVDNKLFFVLLYVYLKMLVGSGSSITGVASTVVRDNLDKNVALVSNSKGK